MEEKVKRLKLLLSKTGMKQKDYAAKTNVTTGLVSKIMTGNAKISDNMEKKTIEIFNLNKEWWETGEGPIFKPGGYRGPDDFKGSYSIPVLGGISAGFPNIVSEEVISYISLPSAPVNSFALIVKGDSMAPTINNGDHVIFVENGYYYPGDVLVVLNEWGEATLKRLKERDGKKLLVPDNPNYPTMEPNDNYQTKGKVVAVWRQVRF